MNKLDQFCTEKNLAESTKGLYNAAVSTYEEICSMTLDDLILEADTEELEGIRWKDRKIKNRLIIFRKWLFENKSEGTANRYLNCIQTIYRHYELELHTLPSYSSKNIDKTYEKRFEDIPNKSEIIDAYYETSSCGECIILLGISSGLSKIDMLKMNVEELIIAFEKYFKLNSISFIRANDLLDVLFQLKEYDELIPVFEGERQKTGSRYTTFASPEFSERVLHYLIGRDMDIKEKYQKTISEANEDINELLGVKECFNSKEEILSFIEDFLLTHDDDGLTKIYNKVNNTPERLEYNHKVFDITAAHLSYSFRKINNKLNFGKVGKFTKFRCHQLRAYHASTLLNLEENAFTESEVDALQGRKKDKTHRAYFTESLSKLYAKYYESVDNVMLFKEIHGISPETVEKLEKENNFYKKEIVRNERKMEEQQKTIDEIIRNQRELEALLGL